MAKQRWDAREEQRVERENEYQLRRPIFLRRGVRPCVPYHNDKRKFLEQVFPPMTYEAPLIYSLVRVSETNQYIGLHRFGQALPGLRQAI